MDAFELWCWRTLLRVPWTARRSNQSILKEISPGCSLEGLMLKLKLQYFGYLIWRDDSLEKTLMLGGIGGRRKRGWQRMRWLDGITDLMDMRLSELRELVMDREAWRAVIHWVAKCQTQLSDWTELNWYNKCVPGKLQQITVKWILFTYFNFEYTNWHCFLNFYLEALLIMSSLALLTCQRRKDRNWSSSKGYIISSTTNLWWGTDP